MIKYKTLFFQFCLFTEATEFIRKLKKRAGKKGGERGRKYRRIQASPMKTPPPGLATWTVDPGYHCQVDYQADLEDPDDRDSISDQLSDSGCLDNDAEPFTLA